MLSGCSGQAPQPAVYPGAEWTWASSPESLGWSSGKLAVARAYSERIGSAAVMIVDNGVVVDGWGDLAYRYPCHSTRKSLMSALYGIYVAEGRIDLTRTLADLGIDDFTPLTEVEGTATIADLLAARSGVYLRAAGKAGQMIALALNAAAISNELFGELPPTPRP
jgi:CubicO group peptidase (beta-lactamase class C family)